MPISSASHAPPTRCALAALLGLSILAAPAGLGARSIERRPAGGLDLGGVPLSGGEEHWYARNLSLLGGTAPDPWHQRRSAADSGRARATAEWMVLRPDLQLILNTDRPWGRNDGVIWAGRGVTVAAQGGLAGRWGPVRAQIAPVAFRAENAPFPLTPNGRTGLLAFGDARFPRNIDLPQRFGASAYQRLDLGDSYLEVRGFGLTGGVSTARQIWGPARDHPLVLGTNAGGFPHLFAGTSRPWSIGIGEVEGRLITGRIAQSAWSPVQTGERRRFTSALTGSFVPRGLPWLTLGGNREVQGPWPADGLTLDRMLRPFQGVLNDNTGSINANDENGFASVFFRAALAPSGLELYGEMSREDFANDVRWLIQKPDDLAALVLGFARSWSPDGERLRTLRAEVVNGELSHHERLQRGLDEPIPPYLHFRTLQGLTSRGQLLGAPAAYAGAGWTIEWSEHSAEGRRAVVVDRLLRLDWLPASGNTARPEVTYAVRLERLRFRGGADLTWAVGPTYTLNEGLVPGRDALGLHAQLRWRGW